MNRLKHPRQQLYAEIRSARKKHHVQERVFSLNLDACSRKKSCRPLKTGNDITRVQIFYNISTNTPGVTGAGNMLTQSVGRRNMQGYRIPSACQVCNPCECGTGQPRGKPFQTFSQIKATNAIRMKTGYLQIFNPTKIFHCFIPRVLTIFSPFPSP